MFPDENTIEVTRGAASNTDPNGTTVTITIDQDTLNGFYIADMVGGHAYAAAEVILDLVSAAIAAAGFDSDTAADAARETILARADAIRASREDGL